MMPIGIVNLGRHWLGKWLVPWWHQTISWTMMLNHQWGLVAFTWGQFNKKCLRYLSLIWFWKLYEWTARRQLKSPQSLPGRSIHLILVTKRSWSWSWMTYCHLLCAMSSSPPILKYNYFKILPWKSMVKVICVVKGQGHIWPWKFKVKVMAKVKPDGHIRALVLNRYVCFSFCGNRTIFGWDIANSVFDLEKSRSRSWRKSTKI